MQGKLDELDRRKQSVSVVTEIHLQGGLVAVGHAGPDGHMTHSVDQTGPFGFPSDKTSLRSVVHLLVERLIAEFVLAEGSHGIPVGVEVEVVGDGEHDGQPAAVLLGRLLEDVVGEDGHRAAGRVGLLDEERGAGFRRTESWRQRTVTVPAEEIKAEQRQKEIQ